MGISNVIFALSTEVVREGEDSLGKRLLKWWVDKVVKVVVVVGGEGRFLWRREISVVKGDFCAGSVKGGTGWYLMVLGQ